jgi:hypothetical protein
MRTAISPTLRSARLMWTASVDRRDAIFRDHDDARAILLGLQGQLADDRVDLLEILDDADGELPCFASAPVSTDD